MLKVLILLACVTSCAGSAKTVTLTKPPCVIPEWPSQFEIAEEGPEGCPDDLFCLTRMEAAQVIVWIQRMVVIQAILERCDSVEPRPVSADP